MNKHRERLLARTLAPELFEAIRKFASEHPATRPARSRRVPCDCADCRRTRRIRKELKK